MSNPARDVIWPADSSILVRVVMLHVGQGDSTIVLAANGGTYKTLLVDVNLDSKAEGSDVPALMADLLNGEALGVFANTHPHNDHLCGVTRLEEKVRIDEVWHSGHVPGPEDRGAYDDLQAVIRKVKARGGSEVELDASRTPYAFGDAQIYVLSPAEHVKDEIAEEDPKVRRKRIHEHSVVLRVGSGDAWIMLTGDADRDAWELHITDYHADRLPSAVLSAAHHGSRTFFVHNEGEEPYMGALDAIDPEYVIVSAPRQDESRHGHPHDDAMKIYRDKVGPGMVLHTGKDRHSYICDIRRDGTVEVRDDGGRLAESYPYRPDGDGGNGSGGKSGPSVFRPRADVREPRPFA